MNLNTHDHRRQAGRRLPRFVFDYVDGGAEDERCRSEEHTSELQSP